MVDAVGVNPLEFDQDRLLVVFAVDAELAYPALDFKGELEGAEGLSHLLSLYIPNINLDSPNKTY